MSEPAQNPLERYQALQSFVAELYEEQRALVDDPNGQQEYQEAIAEARFELEVFVAEDETVPAALTLGVEAARQVADYEASLSKSARNRATKSNTAAAEQRAYLATLRAAAHFCIEQNVQDERADKVIGSAVVAGLIQAWNVVPGRNGQDKLIRASEFDMKDLPELPEEPPSAPIQSQAVRSPAENSHNTRQSSPIERLFAAAETDLKEIIIYAKTHGALPTRRTFKPDSAWLMFRLDPADVALARKKFTADGFNLNFTEAALAKLMTDQRFSELNKRRHLRRLRELIGTMTVDIYSEDGERKPATSPTSQSASAPPSRPRRRQSRRSK